MRTVDNGDVTLHVRIDGPADGPVVVFSNSLGTDLRVWDALIPHLPAGLRIVRYDKRGHGLSDCPADPWGMDDHIQDLETILDRNDIDSATVVGLSVGGLIAQGLYARRPALVSGLVLMDTAAKIGTPEMWGQRIDAIEKAGIASLADPIMERWFTPEFRAEAPDFALWRTMLIRTPKDGYLKTCAAIRDSDFTKAAGFIAVPTLALAGDQDGSTPPDLVRATAALIPGARFETIARAGHLPCVEQPEATAALIDAFLKETGHV